MESNSAVLNHRGQTYTLTSLAEKILPKITMEEAKIMDARLKGVSVGQIERRLLEENINKLVFVVCAISGADLPPNESFANILSEQFSEFLVGFGYADLTEEEILVAFRLNAKGTKYPSGLEVDRVSLKGSVFNIDSAAKVLANYMTFRNMLDRRCQNTIDGYE